MYICFPLEVKCMRSTYTGKFDKHTLCKIHTEVFEIMFWKTLLVKAT